MRVNGPKAAACTRTGHIRLSDADLNRGAFFSWAIFVVLVALFAAITQVFSAGDFRVGLGGLPPTRIGAVVSSGLGVGLFGGLVAAPVALFGIPLARRISRRLESAPHVSSHLLVYFTYGSTIGAAAVVIVATVCPSLALASPLLAFIALASGFSVPAGWLLSVCCAIRKGASGGHIGERETQP